MNRILVTGILGLVAALMIAACGGGDATATPRPTTAPPTVAPTATTAPQATIAPTATRPPATGTTVAPTAAPAATPTSVRVAATPTAVPVGLPTVAPTATPATAVTIKRGGILKIADNVGVGKSFQVPIRNPNLGQPNESSGALIYQTLFLYDVYDNHVLKGFLADRWEYTPKADGATIFIRPEAKWSDGKPVIAQDLKFNFDVWATPPAGFIIAAASPARNVANAIASMEIVNDKTLKVNLKAPDVSFIALLADESTHIRPAHRTLEQSATDPIGSGSYIFKDTQPDVRTSVVKNPNSWRKDPQGNQLPFLDGVDDILIIDQTQAWAAVSTGQIDLLNKGYGMAVRGKRDEAATKLRGSYIQELFAGNFGWGFRNTPPFNDPRFMMAMHVLTDRLSLAELVFADEAVIDGAGTMPASFGDGWALPMKEILSRPGYRYVDSKTGEHITDMAKLKQGFTRNYKKDPKDIEMAKQLLREAGMDPDKGQFPKFQASVQKRFEDHGVVLTQTMKTFIGVTIPLESFDDAAATDRYTKGQFQSVIFSLYGGALEPSQTLVRLTSRTTPWNHGFLVPHLDALFDQQKAQVDPAKRRDLIWEFQRKFLDAPHVFPGSISTAPTGLAREWVKGHWRSRIVSSSNTRPLDRIWLDK